MEYFEEEEDFTSASIFNALQQQNQELTESLNCIRNLWQCNEESERLEKWNQVQEILQKQLDPISIRSLHSKVYNQHQIFLSFSLWCLKLKVKPKRMSLLRCVMLLSVSHSSQAQKQQESSISNLNLQSFKQKSQNSQQNSQQSQITLNCPSSKTLDQEEQLKKLQQKKDKSMFLEGEQNEQILDILIDKQNLYGHQMFVWRKLLFRINPKNEQNALQVAQILYDKKDYDQTLKVLESIPKDSTLQAEADLLRGLAYRELKQPRKGIEFMKKALYNKKNQHPQPYRCCYEIAQVCFELHRYAEAAFYYENCIYNNKYDIRVRYNQVFAQLNAKLFKNIQRLIEDIFYLNCQGIILSPYEKAMLLTVKARVLASSEKTNEHRKQIYNLYDHAIYLFQRPGEQANSFDNPHNEIAHFFKAIYIFRKGEYIEAKYQFQNCLKFKGFCFQTFIFLVMCSIEISPPNVRDFIFYFKNIQQNLRNIPSNPDTIIHLNEMLRLLKQKNLVKKAFITQEKDQACQKDLIKIYQKKLYEDINQKIDVIEKWLRQKSIPIVKQLVVSSKFLFDLEMHELCFSELDRAQELNNKLQSIYTLRGECHLKLQEFDKAEQQFRMALKRDENSLRALKGMFAVLSRKESKEEMFDVLQRIVKNYNKLKPKQKQSENPKQQCMYKRKLANLLLKKKRAEEAYVNMLESIYNYAADHTYHLAGMELYLGFKKQHEAKVLFEELEKHRHRDKVCWKDLVTGFLLVGDTIKLNIHLESQDIQTKEEKEFKCLVQTIIGLRTCKQEEIQEQSSLVMEYLNRIRNNDSKDEMSVFTASAIAFRTAETLHSRQLYNLAAIFYQNIPVLLHPDFCKKIQQCRQLANNSYYATSLRGRIQVLQREFLLPSSKSEENKFIFGFKKQNEKLLQLLKIYQEADENLKQQALVQQTLKAPAVVQSEKVLFLQTLFDMQRERKGYQVAEKLAINRNNPFGLFLFYLYFQKEKGLIRTFGAMLKQIMKNPSSKMLLTVFKTSIAKKANTSTKAILSIIDEFNKKDNLGKRTFIESIESVEGMKRFFELRKQEIEKNLINI